MFWTVLLGECSKNSTLYEAKIEFKYNSMLKSRGVTVHYWRNLFEKCLKSIRSFYIRIWKMCERYSVYEKVHVTDFKSESDLI